MAIGKPIGVRSRSYTLHKFSLRSSQLTARANDSRVGTHRAFRELALANILHRVRKN